MLGVFELSCEASGIQVRGVQRSMRRRWCERSALSSASLRGRLLERLGRGYQGLPDGFCAAFGATAVQPHQPVERVKPFGLQVSSAYFLKGTLFTADGGKAPLRPELVFV